MLPESAIAEFIATRDGNACTDLGLILSEKAVRVHQALFGVWDSGTGSK